MGWIPSSYVESLPDETSGSSEDEKSSQSHDEDVPAPLAFAASQADDRTSGIARERLNWMEEKVCIIFASVQCQSLRKCDSLCLLVLASSRKLIHQTSLSQLPKKSSIIHPNSQRTILLLPPCHCPRLLERLPVLLK